MLFQYSVSVGSPVNHTALVIPENHLEEVQDGWSLLEIQDNLLMLTYVTQQHWVWPVQPLTAGCGYVKTVEIHQVYSTPGLYIYIVNVFVSFKLLSHIYNTAPSHFIQLGMHFCIRVSAHIFWQLVCVLKPLACRHVRLHTCVNVCYRNVHLMSGLLPN